MKKLVLISCLIICGLIMISAVFALPEMGKESNPTNSAIAPHYLNKSVVETGCRNVVSAIILSYRGYDTLAALTLIFTALLAIVLITGRETPKVCCEIFVMPSLLVRAIAIPLFPLFLGFAFYVLLGGSSYSGGGFQGGALIATAFIIYSLIFGLAEVVNRVSLSTRVFLESLAVLTFTFVGLLGILTSEGFLTTTAGIFRGSLIRGVVLLSLDISIGLGCGAILVSLFYLIKKVD